MIEGRQKKPLLERGAKLPSLFFIVIIQEPQMVGSK
jgi:hypothetical protein